MIEVEEILDQEYFSGRMELDLKTAFDGIKTSRHSPSIPKLVKDERHKRKNKPQTSKREQEPMAQAPGV